MKDYTYLSIKNNLYYRLVRHIGAKPEILWLASYPRSGNTFFRAILKFTFDIPSYDIYRLRRPGQGNDVGEAMGLTSGQTRRNPATGRRILVLKTHASEPKDHFPAVYLVRDGRDALVSHAHFQMKGSLNLTPEERTHEEFVETLRFLLDKGSYGGWSGNIEAWTRQSTTHLIKFEDLITAPLETARASMLAAGYPLPEGDSTSVPTFEELHGQHPAFFRRGRVGGWRDEMPDDIHRLFWQKHGETMIKLGYTDGMPA